MLLRLALTFLLLTVIPGLADGIFKSVVSLGTQKPVDIPGQTAVISHRDGKETLTVWNTVQAEGQDLAWVLPLPAPPEIIQETSPAALRLLQVMSAPVVKTGYGSGTEVLILLTGLCLGALLLLCRRPQRVPAGLKWVAAGGVIVLVCYLFLPAYTSTFGSSGGSVAGVRVLSQQETGNYELSVVSGDSAEAVNNWLSAGKFPAFAGGELKVVEDYIAKKWVFLCAKLKTGVSGPAATHPVTVRFASEQPVYPMRLTAGAGTVPVELFVLGEKPAIDRSRRVKAVQFVMTDALPHHGLGRDYSNTAAVINVSRAMPPGPDRDKMLAGNKIPLIPRGQDPLLDALVEDGPWITHLKGTFAPGGDWSDIAVDWMESAEAFERPYYVTRAALVQKAVERYGIWTAAIFTALGLAAHFLARPGSRPHLLWPLGAIVVLAGIAFAGGWSVQKNAVVVEPGQLVRPGGGDEDEDAPRNLLRRWLEFEAARKSAVANSQ